MEEQFIVVPISALQALLQEIQGLKDQIKALEDRQTEDNSNLHREIALDRQRISKLEHKEPQPLQKDRAEILRALLIANNGKLLAKEARKKMHLTAERFSDLLSICDFIETKPYHLDKRQSIIILKSELVMPKY